MVVVNECCHGDEGRKWCGYCHGEGRGDIKSQSDREQSFLELGECQWVILTIIIVTNEGSCEVFVAEMVNCYAGV